MRMLAAEPKFLQCIAVQPQGGKGCGVYQPVCKGLRVLHCRPIHLIQGQLDMLEVLSFSYAAVPMGETRKRGSTGLDTRDYLPETHKVQVHAAERRRRVIIVGDREARFFAHKGLR